MRAFRTFPFIGAVLIFRYSRIIYVGLSVDDELVCACSSRTGRYQRARSVCCGAEGAIAESRDGAVGSGGHRESVFFLQGLTDSHVREDYSGGPFGRITDVFRHEKGTPNLVSRFSVSPIPDCAPTSQNVMSGHDGFSASAVAPLLRYSLSRTLRH